MQNITYVEFLGRYKIRQKLGQGGYGQVFKAYDCETKLTRAYKKIVLNQNEDPYSFLSEIDIQGSLAHPLVIKIFEFYVHQVHHKHYPSKVEIGIISELGNRSLQKLIRDKNNEFPIEEIINFAFHFTKLFAHFQDLKIVHRDIKPQNFVQAGPGLQCKLIDFGLCTKVQKIRNVAGSFAYMSPILKKMYANKELRGSIKSNPYKDDVYSFGLTLYELITRQGPSNRAVEPGHKFSTSVFRKTQNQKLAQIVQMMLEYEEYLRPDFNQLYNIFKQNFEFIQEDPAHQIDGYSEKDLAKMNIHERRAVMKKRVQFQQIMEKTENKKYQNDHFKIIYRVNETEQFDQSNIEKFERKQVYYIDKEMEEEASRRKKRHFGNQKVILREDSTAYSGKRSSYSQQKSPESQKKQFKYNRRHNENERQLGSPQRRIENDKTIEIDKSVVFDQRYENRNEQELNQANQKIVQIPVSVGQQPQSEQQTQPEIQQQVQQYVQYKKQYWTMTDGVGVTALVMMKGYIVCGCSDGSLRVIKPQKKDVSYKVHGGEHSHEGSSITVMTKDAHGMLWSVSENGKVIKWMRTYFFTDLEKQANYTEETVERVNQNGEKYQVKQGWVKLSNEVNKHIIQQVSDAGRITSIFCHKEGNYGLGYQDGYAYIQWNSRPYYYQSHKMAITSIVRLDDEIFTASLDGSITILNTKQQMIKCQKLICPYGIRNFNVTGDFPKLEFFIATVNGRGYKADTTNDIWEIKDEDESPPKDITNAYFKDNQFALILTQNGNILKNGDSLFGSDGGNQWHALYCDGNTNVVIGSLEGYVCLISCE